MHHSMHPSECKNVDHLFFNFHIFRGIPFSANVNSNAPETLCHLDLVAFIVSIVFCQQANDANFKSGKLCYFFFSNKGVFPKIWGHTA